MRIGYEIIGNGPAKVLVLHGWFGDERILDSVRPALSTDQFTYCCVAYRGYGKSRAVSGSYTLEEIATDALSVADHLDWNRFSIIGHSMGAKAAQKIALHDSERVRGLVAVTPVPASAVHFDENGWELFSGAAQDLSKRTAIIAFSTGQRLSPGWCERLARRSFESADPVAFASYLPAWAKTDFATAVRGLSLPVLALVGQHDPHLTLDLIRATYLSSYPHSTVEVLSNCGHYPMDEAPVAFATVTERFLRSLP